jgi:hypothetical protein
VPLDVASSRGTGDGVMPDLSKISATFFVYKRMVKE